MRETRNLSRNPRRKWEENMKLIIKKYVSDVDWISVGKSMVHCRP
jgi:hypothetical protein